ncbi:MAG: hypothetical protein AAF497_06750 [Planctomycetota bacterium]
MARVYQGLLSFAAVVLMSAVAMAQCQDCQTGGCSTGGCPGVGGGGIGGCLTGNCSPWNRPYTEESSPDVFYNFYQPGNGGSPAGAFPAPYPTPHRVGHQYTTYQPFMPNEWLYQHYRTYHQPYNNGTGLNRTTVHWYGTPLRTDLLTLRKFFSKAR